MAVFVGFSLGGQNFWGGSAISCGGQTPWSPVKYSPGVTLRRQSPLTNTLSGLMSPWMTFNEWMYFRAGSNTEITDTIMLLMCYLSFATAQKSVLLHMWCVVNSIITQHFKCLPLAGRICIAQCTLCPSVHLSVVSELVTQEWNLVKTTSNLVKVFYVWHETDSVVLKRQGQRSRSPSHVIQNNWRTRRHYTFQIWWKYCQWIDHFNARKLLQDHTTLTVIKYVIRNPDA